MTRKNLHFFLLLMTLFKIGASLPVAAATFGSGVVCALLEATFTSIEECKAFGRHTIRLEIIGQGEVLIIPNLKRYPHNKLIKLQAIPATGWIFSHWGRELPVGNPLTFPITADINSVAVFIPEKLLPFEKFVAITGNESHSLALRHDGTGWFLGTFSGFSNGFTKLPLQVEDLSDVVGIATGRWHSLGLQLDGTVWATGNNSYGQLGDGSKSHRNFPAPVHNLNNITVVASGLYHLALQKNDTVWAWEWNANGQLGVGSTDDHDIPV